jgi:hypothetical protein
VLPTDHCADFKAWQMPAEEKKTLPWKYCECGCKGWELDIGGMYFWMYWDLGKRWYLGAEHGMLGAQGPYKSAPEVEAIVIKELREALPQRELEHRAIAELLLQHDVRTRKP